MATKTIPDLPAATSVVAATLFPIVNDPAGTPVTQKATGTQLDAYIRSAGGALTATTLDGSGGALTINTAQADKDVVVSSTGMVNLLFTDAGNNRVGINTATPTVALQVVGTVTATLFSGDGSALTSLPTITTAAFLTVAGNPATPVDANCWYNSTANTFRGYTTAFTATWSAGASLLSAGGGRTNQGTGMGTISSALVAGGTNSSTDYGNTSEKYNGTSWSATGNISQGRYDLCGSGTTTSALTVGGIAPANSNTADAYNGTTWSATTVCSYSPRFPGAAGTSSSSTLIAGGVDGSFVSTTAVFNGSSWAAGGALPTVRYAVSCFGTVSAALSAGGENSGGITLDVYTYNGTSWSTITSLPSIRKAAGSSGTLTSCMVYGGQAVSGTSIGTVVAYNGTAWSTTTSLTTARDSLGSVGPSNTSAMAIAGNSAGRLSSTEVYTEGMVSSSKTFTVS